MNTATLQQKMIPKAMRIVVATVALLSCAQGNDILSTDHKTPDNRNAPNGENIPSEGDEFASANAGGDSDDGSDNSDGSGEVVYPRLGFNGNGSIDCGKHSPMLADSLDATLAADRLEVTVAQAQISGAGKADAKANEEIQQSIGTTIYRRPTAAEKKELGKFNFATYAIFANAIEKKAQNETFTMEKPLPVFPWPAGKARYEDLKKKGSETWSSKVTGGGRTFTAKITVSYVSEVGDEVVLKFLCEIPEDVEGSKFFRSIYEIFPVPREAEYTINSKTKDVRKLKSTSWFNGEKCKNAPSSVDLVYNLCVKTTGDKSVSYGCH